MNKGLLIALVTSRDQCRGRIADGCGGSRGPRDRCSSSWRWSSHGDRFCLGIPRCLSLRLILSLFDSRRMSLGGRLCYTIFLTMGTVPAVISIGPDPAVIRQRSGTRPTVVIILSHKLSTPEPHQLSRLLFCNHLGQSKYMSLLLLNWDYYNNEGNTSLYIPICW